MVKLNVLYEIEFRAACCDRCVIPSGAHAISGCQEAMVGAAGSAIAPRPFAILDSLRRPTLWFGIMTTSPSDQSARCGRRARHLWSKL